MLGPFKYMHTILGFTLLGLTIYLWKIVNDIKFISSSFMVNSVNFIMGLIITDIFRRSFSVLGGKTFDAIISYVVSSLLVGLSVASFTFYKISMEK